MHEDITFDLVVMVMALLFTASIVAIASKRIRFPFTILLVITGLLMGWAAQVFPKKTVLIFRSVISF